ncbi:hypothetical protein [Streptomyces sp. NPDC000410]|uniref:hypothetical protein n=1 Tax=Streptomyces sp. NPDC000410 TaxID=3154254 RepID=UPI00333217D1
MNKRIARTLELPFRPLLLAVASHTAWAAHRTPTGRISLEGLLVPEAGVER